MNDAVMIGIKVVGVLAAFLTLPLMVGQMERKAMAHMQGRLGPTLGSFGWARVAFPRLREDQVQRLAWQGLVRIALGQLVLTGAVVAVS